MKVILASNSPRRKELLKLIVENFEVMPSNIDEILQDNLIPQEQVINLSYRKAKDIYKKTNGNRIIIGSDTIVVKDEKIYGKPKNKQNAKQMIKKLLQQDKSHKIITGLSVIIYVNGEYIEYKLFDEVKVYLKDILDEEIDRWIETGKAMDKAAGYGIQNEFCVFIDKIEGNYTSAVGLPTHKLYDIIKEYIY